MSTDPQVTRYHTAPGTPRIRRVVFALALCLSLFAPAISSDAHAESGQTEGSHAWGRDGWCYVVTGGRWVRDAYFRNFPDRNNGMVYDLYYNGQYLKRVDVSEPGWTKELLPANTAPSSAITWYKFPKNATPTEANSYFYVTVFRQWMTLAQVKAAVAQVNRQGAPMIGDGINNQGRILGGYGGSTGVVPGGAGTYIGGGTSTPNPNPLTVDSMAADRARQQMSPHLRQQLLAIEGYMQQRYDESIKVDTLGTHVRVRR